MLIISEQRAYSLRPYVEYNDGSIVIPLRSYICLPHKRGWCM